MPHFAKLDDNNIVEKVNVYSQEDVDANGGDYSTGAEEWVEAREGGSWKQTSYNGNAKKQYAGVGYTYNASEDKFVCPKPFDSWTLDSSLDWQPPVTRFNTFDCKWSDDSDNDIYSAEWNESAQTWKGYALKLVGGVEQSLNYTWNKTSKAWDLDS